MNGPRAGSAGVRVVRELKRDALGRVELLARGRELRVRRVADGGRWPGSRLVARLLLERERRALARIEGMGGVPQSAREPEFAGAPSLDGRPPRECEVLVRTWLEGEPLHLAAALPQDTFERLEELVRELHGRGVCHNDLHKEQNVVIGRDGWPHLIDFQLASTHSKRSRVFENRAREDLRHVEKLRRRYLRADGGYAAKLAQRAELGALRRSPAAWLWRRGGKPAYHFVTRRLLHTSDGEARRPNGGPWPVWTPPTGPRVPS